MALAVLGALAVAAAPNPTVPSEAPSSVGTAAIGEPGPGAADYPAELASKLKTKWNVRARDYKPRSRHLNQDGTPKYASRLYLETSPYLLQHAHNPVNWFPWGSEAFEEARRRGVAVLLSVGYSTCHWCHVMEEESFEDLEIARYLNENYVAIKVDREERPDVDAVYMTAVQMLTGSGGWPMTVWLTPDRKPFFGGTYFPPRDGERGKSSGFLSLLKKFREIYLQEPDRVGQAAKQIVAALQQQMVSSGSTGGLPGPSVLQAAAAMYRGAFDETSGGTSGAPKFPSSLNIRFLLRYHRRTGERDFLRMAELTLEKMAAGGVCDQIGGGFHRYSTDANWLVPHFEKMLYDNALLVLAYLEGYQATGRKDFREVAERILRYVERDMTSPEGAFYSAEDADSLSPSGHREEGRFYTWTPQELESVLGAERAKVVSAYYGVEPGGNFEGRSILHAARAVGELARELGRKPEQVRDMLMESRETLYQARKGRPAPLRDEKILAEWNGLMVSALARAGFVLGEARYVHRAERAAEFLLGPMRKAGRLLHSYKDGQASLAGYLEDYAFVIAGLLDLFEATGKIRWLQEARALDRVLAADFEDTAGGGFFKASRLHEELLAREKPSYDGAIPSGNSVEALNLLRMRELTVDEGYRKRADRVLSLFGSTLERSPSSLSEMLLALDFRLDSPKEIVLVAARSLDEVEPLFSRLRTAFVPNKVVVLWVEGATLSHLAADVPLVEAKVAMKGRATAYVCENMACKLPTSDPEVFAKQLQTTEPLAAR